MCGITGKISFNKKDITPQEIETMNNAIKHRGPDDGGAYISPDNKVGLGHRRLSIIDLSPLGHQPMRYMDRYEIVFNGEIYNFQEKRDLLEKEGYTFVSHSDTEVILALYDKYGKECVKHLRGMFAFAIYDEQEQTLFCTRDRVGKKPFKYYIDENVFLFASELKAILTQPEYHKEPDYVAIHHYLTLQYVPAPLTGFVGIKKLQPAHYLFIDLKTKKVENESYWKLDYSKKLDLSEEEWKKRVIDKLDESVRLRMISDVPIGAFLSGGIDSSAIVALMAKNSPTPIKTFSIGFDEEKFNELKYAKIIADKFKTDHTEFIVKPDAIHLLPMLVKQYEEPYADSSALPTYYVAKLTRAHVTVALNGDGGDENFAGYSRYSAFQISTLLDHFNILNKLFGEPITRFLKNSIKNTFFDRLHRFSKSISDDYRRRYLSYTAYFTNEQKSALYTDEFKKKVWDQDTYDIIAREFRKSGSKNRTEQAVYADFITYLPEDLMTKVDIATMAVSLEGRSPFLDHEFLELTAQIPFHLKLKGLNNKKYILKEALRGLIPDEVMFRPKMGFGIPIAHWFRNELKDYTREKLLDGRLVKDGLLKKEYIQHILDQHCNTNINFSPHIWALLTLELWFEEYFPA
ncbi:MAG: asparagine synthase (glutamine-hydrolyzing) [Candidatus Moranbacteria bacterium]|nr:asparagine synthase (glutamine-hydrolyzing) [Candidatus Moranbacteria bacterium]MDD3964949.1 asparagine synthase (glutamine-hydrolyzing) [Candidatus Moranbacteria bacterium]